MTEPYDPEADFRPESFIARAGWQAAAKPFRDPHEYTLRGRVTAGVEPPDVAEHDRFIRHIEEHGHDATFEGTRYRYLDVNGFTYWVSRGIYEPRHPIINRRPANADA
jgi:hypothetical protein